MSYGVTGEFGRFRSARPVQARRGDLAVVRSHRGLELAAFLCPARPGHAQFLPNTTVGPLLRLATPEDLATSERMRQRAQELFGAARAVVEEFSLPLEILDAELLLTRDLAVVHHLAWGTFDERELVSRLASRFEVRVALHSLAVEPEPAAEEHGCGSPDCGGGNCGSCGTGGGCSSCSEPSAKEREHFADLRRQMEQSARQRTPLV